MKKQATLADREFRKLCATDLRGYLVYEDIDGKMKWLDNDKVVESLDERPCKFCGKFNIYDEKGNCYDACLGKLPGVSNACCGHGLKDGYISFENGTRVTLTKIERGNEIEMLKPTKPTKLLKINMGRKTSTRPSR